MICDFNYDPKFLNEIRKSELTCEKMISDHQNGWYWIAKNQTLPVIEEMRQKLDPTKDIVKKTFEILDEAKAFIFDHENEFIREYYELLPMCDKTPELVVFSHNDIHDGNFLKQQEIVDGRKVYNGVKLIDFEYANYNFRGIDLAKYLD